MAKRHVPQHIRERGAGRRHIPAGAEPADARYKREVRDENPWMQRWYGLAQWRRLRTAQREREPDCRLCGSAGQVVDHIVPHAGNWRLFIDPGNLQTLCYACHAAKSAIDGSTRVVRRRRPT